MFIFSLQVLFEGTRAVGVQYLHQGVLRTVHARKEVILSAGAIGSPHILMLSGVGPKKQLQDLRVTIYHIFLCIHVDGSRGENVVSLL